MGKSVRMCDEKSYINTHVKTEFECLNCHHRSYATLNSITSRPGIGCKKCSGLLPYTIESFTAKLKELNRTDIFFIDSEFKNTHTKHKFLCSKGHIIEKSPHEILSGQGCGLCFTSNHLDTIESFKQKLIDRRRFDVEFIDDHYEGANKKYWFRCTKHNHVFKTWAYGISCGTRGCPRCSDMYYIGQTNMHNALSKMFPDAIITPQFSLKHDHLKDLPSCPNKWMTIDDKIIINNQQIFCEYQGLQHFEARNFGGEDMKKANEDFQKRLLRDEFLRNYCKQKNYILIEVDGRKYFTEEEIRNFLHFEFVKIGILPYPTVLKT